MRQSTLSAILAGVWFVLGMMTVLRPEENHFAPCLLAQFTLAFIYVILAVEERMKEG